MVVVVVGQRSAVSFKGERNEDKEVDSTESEGGVRVIVGAQRPGAERILSPCCGENGMIQWMRILIIWDPLEEEFTVLKV